MAKAARPEGGLLEVRVTPRARRTAIGGWRGSALSVHVTAAPTDGRANRAVAELLAETLGVPRSAVLLVGGAASRDKRFRVAGLSPGDLRARLPRDGA
jgi:hypothetical protein